MSADTLFQLGNSLAMLGWILLAAAPIWNPAERLVSGVVVSLFALAYSVLIAYSFKASDFAAFGSLQGVKALFQSDFALLAGWFHYLAFDLFVGSWIYRNARTRNIPHPLFLLCGLFTFMLGPCGLLLYLIIRALRGRGRSATLIHE